MGAHVKFERMAQFFRNNASFLNGIALPFLFVFREFAHATYQRFGEATRLTTVACFTISGFSRPNLGSSTPFSLRAILRETNHKQ
jgi:hypothetical protein